MSRWSATTRGPLVRALLRQKTYAEMLGLDLEDKSDWFPWFVAAALFAKPIRAEVARNTASLLFTEGVTTPEAIEKRGWDDLVTLLDRGGYVRYDFSTATRLLTLAGALPGDRLQRIVADTPLSEIRKRLMEIKGVGPKMVEIFLRELRGIRRTPLPMSQEAKRAARRLKIGLERIRLREKDLARLESVLVRVWIEHCKRRRWRTCPAGRACGCLPKPEIHSSPDSDAAIIR
jgi:endonuclease III